ncbi:Outer membrane receptor proteins, mostly Fe transport [Chitinophaga eiseniae]|uniref:Outer membrane receptor proteins, mostly Fe transport n=1 Tax=Chitinophaga eiseniae TaxID=634771 RepID=A0A1T4R2N2_9BACT|nr:TonB-dependent receptor [Chitinophaga eiseniae]SKA10137.1 Outer membrane receptor proteins, mostly Fe transport [Chitinophaga eiseniae]
MLVLAQAYKSLADKVQLQMGKTNAAAVVKVLQQQTPYTFIYDPEYLQQCTVNEARFPGTPLGEVLSYIDLHTPLDIELSGSNVIALRKGDAPLPAIQTHGRIRGKVVDAKNEPLPGVTVAAQGGLGTITNVDGSYELVVTPGVYSLSFSFVSYETRKVTEITVKDKEIVPLNVVLKNSGSRLKEVTVTGNYRKASIEGLYALQKNNAAITDGISAEQIARTPDKNMGEVLKRVSGLATMDNKYVVVRGLSERYNQAMLNGQIMPSTELNRKNFSFDIIPSNIVENVTVIKTITPDRSAEFGGGLVDVNTLDIPAENFLNLSVGGSYNDKTTGKDFYSLPLSGSEYRGSTAKHRYLFGTLDWKDRFDAVDYYNKEGKNAALFNNNWTITKFKAPVSPNFQASLGRVLRGGAGQQWGLVAAVSYRNTLSTQDIVLGREGFAELEGKPDQRDLLFKGQRYGFVTNLGGMLGIGYRSEKSRIGFQSLYLRTLDQQLIFGTGQNGKFGSDHTLGLFDLAMQTSLWQSQLKGEHAIGRNGIRLKWSGSYLKLDRQKPDNHMLLADYKQVDGAEKNEYNVSSVGSNFSEGALRWWSRALENNYNWDASISVPFKFNTGKVTFDNTFKGGYAGWNKDRLFFVLNTKSNFDNKGENYIPLAKAFTPENNVRVDMSEFGDNFKRRSASLHALFAMFDNRISEKWRLVWGVRAEYYDLNKVNDNLDSTFADLNTVPGKEYDYSELLNREPNWHFFPSVNLTYSLTPSMNLRLAYSESIIRPDLRELSVFREYDFELGGEYTASLVRSTTIKHMDFRYEWYPGPGEILSASFFYKDLSYPMEIYRRGMLNSYELLNSKSAKNYGVELEVRKSLAFTKLPILRNFTLYGNFTYLDATVKPMTVNIGLDPMNAQRVVVKETIGEEERRPQMGASNFMFNAGIYYDMNPVSVSLNYNSITNRVFLPSTVYRESLMERPLRALDAQVGFRFLKQRAELKLNFGNLLNSYAVIYINQFTAEQYQDFANGKKPGKKDMSYDAGKDFVNFKSMPGRTYSATFTYRF